jgi:BA14K-like protein
MNSLKILGAAAALALVLPLATPSASFAQSRLGGGGGGGHAAFGGGGGGARMGGGAVGGGAIGGGAAFRGGGGNFAASPAMRPGVAAPSFSGGSRVAAGVPSGNWNGGNWRGGNWHGGGWRHRGGFWPGVAAGAAIGALGSYAYSGGPYYDPYYYGDDYYYNDSPAVAVVPDTGGDSAAYCAQRYRSYDPASGTYLGYDGLRHPCP